MQSKPKGDSHWKIRREKERMSPNSIYHKCWEHVFYPVGSCVDSVELTWRTRIDLQLKLLWIWKMSRAVYASQDT